MNDPTPTAAHQPPLERLAASQQDFVGFVERRVHDRALAEDIVQQAFSKSLDRLAALRDDESSVAWFYRVLRHAIIDQARAATSRAQSLERLAAELEARPDAPLPDDHQALCRCVARLADGLKPAYAEALRRVDIDGVPVTTFASEAGITASNAGVRLFRARAALRAEVSTTCGACAEEGCRDCTCGRR